MVVAKVFKLKKYFQGEPKSTDLSVVEEELPPLKDGEFVAQAEYLSVDPYMRKLSAGLALGSTMTGSQVAVVVESRNPDYPPGSRVVGYMGWRTHTIMHPDRFAEHSLAGRRPYLVPDYEHLPASVSLGVLGQPGLTAYFGLTEICKPKAGETIVVSGAAGAVGSLVGQMAKFLGLKAIGITGSDVKCRWLVDELGFDHAINYKTHKVAEELKKAAPHGIDCYFDNVGGEISSTVIYRMNQFGRVAVCGSISAYNDDPNNLTKCTIIQPPVVRNQLTIQGFLVAHFNNRKFEGFEQIHSWIKNNGLRYRETVTEGFDNMFEAFAEMLAGKNFGKAIVRV